MYFMPHLSLLLIKTSLPLKMVFHFLLFEYPHRFIVSQFFISAMEEERLFNITRLFKANKTFEIGEISHFL